MDIKHLNDYVEMKKDIVGTGDNFIFGSNTSIYTTLTVIGLDSGARIQVPIEITRTTTS